MEITVAILIGLLQVSIVTGRCKNLRMFRNEIEVTNFECTEYVSNACVKGPFTFPGNLTAGLSISKPQDLQVIGIRDNFTNSKGHTIRTSGIIFTWMAPLDASSREKIKGFYLKLLRVNNNKTICKLFDLRKVDMTTRNNFIFSFELFPFTSYTCDTYRVFLTSLPPPSDEQFDLGLYQDSVFTTLPYHDYLQPPGVYPDNWITWISVKPYSFPGNLEVRFGFPTEDSLAKFTTFSVKLIKVKTLRTREATIYRDRSETFGEHTFYNVASGMYSVQVTPKDLNFGHIQTCQCWFIFYGFRNCGICRSSDTEYFSFRNDRISSRSATREVVFEADDDTSPTVDDAALMEHSEARENFIKLSEQSEPESDGKNETQNNNETDKQD